MKLTTPKAPVSVGLTTSNCVQREPAAFGDNAMYIIKRVDSFPDYWVDTRGNVFSCKTRKHRLKPYIDIQGYCYLTLREKGNRRRDAVHRIAAKAFLGTRPLGKEVNHKDLDKENNCVENLEYITHKDNSLHAAANGKMAHHHGDKNGRAKLTWPQVKRMRTQHKSGVGTAILSRQYGVSKSQVCGIISGTYWKREAEDADDTQQDAG